VTKVVHVRLEPYDIYIGRAFAEFHESDWHNPFHIEGGCGRKCVLEKYEAHVRSRPDLMARLGELRGKTLGCWCKKKKPKACHGDVLANLVREAYGEDEAGVQQAPDVPGPPPA